MPIRRVANGYKIDNVPGVSRSYGEAVKRLKAIKARKKQKRKRR